MILDQIFAGCCAGWWDREKLKPHHKSFFSALFVGLLGHGGASVGLMGHIQHSVGPTLVLDCTVDQIVSLVAEKVSFIIRYLKLFTSFFMRLKNKKLFLFFLAWNKNKKLFF